MTRIKPETRIWKRPLSFSPMGMFKAVGKLLVDGGTGNWTGVAKDSVDVVGALGIGDNAGDQAGRLVTRALGRAVLVLIDPYKMAFDESISIEAQVIAAQIALNGSTWRTSIFLVFLCSAQICEAQVYKAQVCKAQVCWARICEAQVYKTQICNTQVCNTQVCKAQLCKTQICEAQTCEAQTCNTQVCEAQICKTQVCNTQICKAQICKAQICKAQICKAQICKTQVSAPTNLARPGAPRNTPSPNPRTSAQQPISS